MGQETAPATVGSCTKESPFFLLYGRDPPLPSGADLDVALPRYPADVKAIEQSFLSLSRRHVNLHWTVFGSRKRNSRSFMIGNRLLSISPCDGIHA